jgi:hypothetical protein
MLDDLQALADHIGSNEPTEASLSQRVYKDTACGAWLEIAHNEDGTLWGVRVGSIVEGSDACVDPVELRFPFSEKDWSEAIDYVEGEASLLWDEAHPEGG